MVSPHSTFNLQARVLHVAPALLLNTEREPRGSTVTMEAALNAHLWFWTAEHNPARAGAALCDDSTVPGHQRRLRAFAAFAAETAPTAFGVASIPSNPFALLFADNNCTALTHR
jgi:hypothetical protein